VTREASQTARRASKRTVGVNGDKLAQLMIEHEVDVSREVVYLPEVDGAYFDEDGS
jgi:restriction endonuclease Mrr